MLVLDALLQNLWSLPSWVLDWLLLAWGYRLCNTFALLGGCLILDIVLEALILILNLILLLTFSYAGLAHSEWLLLGTSPWRLLVALGIIFKAVSLVDRASLLTLPKPLSILWNTGLILSSLKLWSFRARAQHFVIVLVSLYLLDTAIFLYLAEVQLVELLLFLKPLLRLYLVLAVVV